MKTEPDFNQHRATLYLSIYWWFLGLSIIYLKWSYLTNRGDIDTLPERCTELISGALIIPLLFCCLEMGTFRRKNCIFFDPDSDPMVPRYYYVSGSAVVFFAACLVSSLLSHLKDYGLNAILLDTFTSGVAWDALFGFIGALLILSWFGETKRISPSV